MHKSEEMKANIAFVKEHCFTRSPPPPMHIKCDSAIGKHNSGWRENRGAPLGGNLAN